MCPRPTGQGKPTLLAVLARQLCNGITDLVANNLVGFGQQGFKQLLPDGNGLVLFKREKCIDGVSLVVIALLGGDATKDDGCKRANLPMIG